VPVAKIRTLSARGLEGNASRQRMCDLLGRRQHRRVTLISFVLERFPRVVHRALQTMNAWTAHGTPVEAVMSPNHNMNPITVSVTMNKSTRTQGLSCPCIPRNTPEIIASTTIIPLEAKTNPLSAPCPTRSVYALTARNTVRAAISSLFGSFGRSMGHLARHTNRVQLPDSVPLIPKNASGTKVLPVKKPGPGYPVRRIRCPLLAKRDLWLATPKTSEKILLGLSFRLGPGKLFVL